MTFRHLKIFITVADTGSMTAAAKVLYIAQPTVSQAVSDLEEYYGVKLFDRLAKRLYLTDKGTQLLSYARHLISLMNEMEQVMKNPDKVGVIKVGASLTIGAYLLPQLVRRFKRQYPFLQVRATTKNTLDIERLLLQNAIDFAIVEGVVHTPDIVATPFMDDKLLLVCGKAHPLYQTGPLLPADLANLQFIVREQGSGTRELFENMMATQEIKWQLAWECNGSDVLKNAAVKGVGVAVISQRLVERELAAGDLSIVRVAGLDLKRKFSIVHHKNKFLTEPMKAFIALCREYPGRPAQPA
ncbi:MAG: LysR family transcriptional regulator [Veillonellaceae bacterium]|nr:LysR family transcriptional regulator [Veillonellaceae bacterium]